MYSIFDFFLVFVDNKLRITRRCVINARVRTLKVVFLFCPGELLVVRWLQTDVVSNFTVLWNVAPCSALEIDDVSEVLASSIEAFVRC